MNIHENVPTSHGATCPSCGVENVRTTSVEHSFGYGAGVDAVILTCAVVLNTCLTCEFEFLAADAEEAQYEAICRYLANNTGIQ